MKTVLLTEDGKKVVVGEDDECLFKSPCNPPNTGTKYTRGTNLYVHKARSGNVYFYFYSWSLWQGEESEYSLCSPTEAEKFLTEKAGNSGEDSLSLDEIERAEKYGFKILEETA